MKIFKTKPYNYQKDIIYKALDIHIDNGFCGYLMEMGTGKTISSLYTAYKLKKENKIDGVLVIPPKALFTTWYDEIFKHTHPDFDRKLFFWDSKKAKNISFTKELSELFITNSFPILIANIELFQTKQLAFFKTIKSYLQNKRIFVIMDESGKIKNPTANRTKNLIKHTRDAAYRSILTGTEFSNSVLDLFTQFEFLKSNFWGLYQKTLSQRYHTFKSRYMILRRMKVKNPLTGKIREFDKICGPKPHLLQEIHDKIAPYIVRAMKKDHLDIPDKIFTTVKIQPNNEQVRIYNDLKTKMWSVYKDQEITVTVKIALYTRFRQIAGGFMPETGDLIGESSPKLDFIAADSSEYSGKIIVWAFFRPEIEFITSELNKIYKKEVCVPLYGGQKNDYRQEVQGRFKNDPEIKYLAVSPPVGSHGLNLQFCSLAYYFSNDLSADTRYQTEDRIHRDGQSNHPVYKDLVAVGTLDGSILRNLNSKQNDLVKFQGMSTKEFFDVL